MMKQRPFAVFDIDGTLIRWQLYHAVVESLTQDGKIPEPVALKINAARLAWKNRDAGAESFAFYEETLVEGYHEALKVLSPSDIDVAIEKAFSLHGGQTYTYTRSLIQTLKDEGYLLFAISGSHQQIVTKIGALYGFDDTIGAEYHTDAGAFTGTRTTPIVVGKGVLLNELAAKHNVTWAGSVAIGDSKSDAAMLELVERPIAFNPDQRFYTVAAEKGWPIVIERKNMVYRLEKSDDVYTLAEVNI